MAVSGPPTALSVNLTDANGVVTRLGSEDTNPAMIPSGISFRTARDGFGDASLTLNRRIDRDWVDLGLLDEIELVGADGTTAYEGRIGAIPRNFDSSHTISLQCAGWISHMRDRLFSMIYVDRDLNQWGAVSQTEQVGLVVAGYANFGSSVAPDNTGGVVLRLLYQGAWATGGLPMAVAMYDAGSTNLIGSLYYSWTRGTNVSTGGDPNYTWMAKLTTSDTIGSGQDTTADLQAAGPASGTLTATAARRFAMLRHHYDVAGGTAGMEYSIDWQVAVFGDHGLTKRGAAPEGFYASDVIRHVVGAYCPKLSTAGVQDTSFAIPHLAFRDPAFPYDALLEVNKYHLWDFAVWDKRTLWFAPIDLTDYDWEIRLDDADYPATVSLQGDSTQELANGIVVTYTNVTTGRQETLLPTTYADLQDQSVDNPFTTHGYQGWKTYQVSVPTTLDGALQLGRAALAEFNQPQAPGSIVIGPHVRDRAGHAQPAWRVRAGDRVSITSSTSLSDRPRMVSETSYDHDSRKVTISVDGSIKALDAVVDRISVALQAANLT